MFEIILMKSFKRGILKKILLLYVKLRRSKDGENTNTNKKNS
jgi:hypothetical protein